MAFQAFVSITGKKQGKFKGESVQANRKGWIPVVAFTMGLKSPHDAATGQVTGKRRLEPVTLVKEWGAASPQGLTACSTNEVLTTVAFEFVKTNASGEDFVFQTVTLTNATISEVHRFTSDSGETSGSTSVPSGPDAKLLENWLFVFQKIKVVDQEGKTSYSDEWFSPIR